MLRLSRERSLFTNVASLCVWAEFNNKNTHFSRVLRVRLWLFFDACAFSARSALVLFLIKKNTPPKALLEIRLVKRRKVVGDDDDARQLAKKKTKKRIVEDLRVSLSSLSVRLFHHICGSFYAFPFRLFFSLVFSPFFSRAFGVGFPTRHS